MRNHLKDQTSPYLLQHADNPVDWYPWGEEAFDKARSEDKPVFVSIGYSTCHWCHVMAHECFADNEVADMLNRHFVSIKVDREERPDIDSVYMTVCQAFTGSGGWPTSIFMTAAQEPFFAGTYFPKRSRHGAVGFMELLTAISEQWRYQRDALLRSAETVARALQSARTHTSEAGDHLPKAALEQYKRSYDAENGGFGGAPKFPAAHNLLFLMTYYQKYGDGDALKMAENTLLHMYSGGLFDHVGYGFSRYSTDRRFLVPHFEKMLYDNALLTLAYCKAYEITKKDLYRRVAEKTADYVLREMTSQDGAFYSAQDADSNGMEGHYYLFSPDEVTRVLGYEDGAAFNLRYGITPEGNFEGKSIPNLLQSDACTDPLARLLPALRAYRRERSTLSTDDKILTAWNALMIAALCALYRVSRNAAYLAAAKKAQRFIEEALCGPDGLHVSFRDGKRTGPGFLDDYANYSFALLALYHATLDEAYLRRAQTLTKVAISNFLDREHGGFYLYGRAHETLLFRPKECYDGATPSGNSMMAYDLVLLRQLRVGEETDAVLQRQLGFLGGEAENYPMGYAMFLTTLLQHFDPPATITAVAPSQEDIRELPFLTPLDGAVRILREPTDEYPLLGGGVTYYVCRNKSCLPPVNSLSGIELS